MKKDSLPNSFKKNRLLHDRKISDESLIEYGELFFESGRLIDAANFFNKVSFQEGLDRLKKVAVEQGDSFLFQNVLRSSHEKEVKVEWEALGNKAMELKKYSHAIPAFQAAGNEESQKKAEEALKSLS